MNVFAKYSLIIFDNFMPECILWFMKKELIKMSKTGFRCKIEDWYGIHPGFPLSLRPGYTALVGPNGAGKTTLLRQVEEIAKAKGYDVFYYSNQDY